MKDTKRRITNTENVNKMESVKNIKENNQKDQNNIGFKYILKDYFKFYKTNLMKKHIIIYIICLAVFFFFIATFISRIKATPNIAELAENAKKISENSEGIFLLILKKKIPLLFMIIFAGIVPYLFVPVMGIGTSYYLALDIATNFNVLTGKSSVIPMCIGAIVQLIAVSLSVAVGIKYTLISTKRWRYSRNQDYSMLDFKMRLYEATNNKNKLKKATKKKEEKIEKNEKYNVKVPYMHLFISLLLSILIISIGALIARI